LCGACAWTGGATATAEGEAALIDPRADPEQDAATHEQVPALRFAERDADGEWQVESIEQPVDSVGSTRLVIAPGGIPSIAYQRLQIANRQRTIVFAKRVAE
jgi:hypothetical protein